VGKGKCIEVSPTEDLRFNFFARAILYWEANKIP